MTSKAKAENIEGAFNGIGSERTHEAVASGALRVTSKKSRNAEMITRISSTSAKPH